MWEFFRENPFGTLVAFCVLIWVLARVASTFINRNKPVTECDCEEFGCHEDEDNEEETK